MRWRSTGARVAVTIVVGSALLNGCGKSNSYNAGYQDGYQAGDVTVQGHMTPESECQSLETVARFSATADLDLSDYGAGCIDGVH